MIVIGICAMDKKTRAKPMAQILARIREYGFFEIVIFGNQVILDEPIENWPRCDALIAFFSGGFPMDKALAYAEKYKPFLINDMKTQYMLLDRRVMYQALEEEGLPLPNFAVMNREEGSTDTLVEGDDYIEVNGKRLNKPFVEKPVDGEDHNIYIYYPRSAGGGSKRLFRKVENKSSEFYPDVNCLRHEGSYIYEEFLPTEGTDVKVYTVGPSYAHAEARKAPTVDGRVKRDEKGKEVRMPVLLTTHEKAIARTVCWKFGQFVCGFDLLRAGGQSYVCDVNGWSFIKNSLYT